MSLVGAPPAAVWVLLFAALIGCAAWRLRPFLAPGWAGAPARLAEVVLALALAIALAELLGLVGLLRGAWLIAGAAALAVASWALARRLGPTAGPAPVGAPARTWELAVASVLAFGLIAIWMLGALAVLDGGPMAFDSLWYHLPLAADFARSGSISAVPALDPATLARFYPADSELVHAMAMAIVHRDVVSPLLNVGWLALAILAGWCIGRPFGTAPLSLLGVAVILGAHVLAVSQAGSATDDIVVVAALLSTAAILVTALGPAQGAARRPARPAPLGPILLSGLAAGIAVGTKLNLLAPIAVLTVGLAVAAAAGTRWRIIGSWLAGILVTGGIWYARDLFVTGNPLPWLHAIGPIDLPSPSNGAGIRPAFTVAQYVTDGSAWSNFFLPGLHVELGDLWPLTLALAVVGMVAAAVRGAAPIVRALGACAIAGAAVYVVTPLSAGGVEGHPVVFATNLRWLAPFLALALGLLAASPIAADRRGRVAVAILLAAPLAASLDLGTWGSDPNLATAVLIAAVVVGTWAVAVALARSGHAPLAVAATVAAVAIAAAVYGPTSRDYLRDRFDRAAVGSSLTGAYRWARGVEGADIGLVGTAAAFHQYPFYGTDLSNRVSYIAEGGPHGSLVGTRTCRAWRAAVNAGRFDYVVTAPRFDPVHPTRLLPAPEGAWTRGAAGAEEVLRDGPAEVFRITGPLDPNGCRRPPA